MNKQSSGRRMFAYLCPAAVIYFMTYFLTYKNTLLTSGSDVVTHMGYALSLDRVLSLTHNGWHFACWLFYALLPADINMAASICTAFFNALSALLVAYLMIRCLKIEFDRRGQALIVSLLTIAALTAGPLYLRFYNLEYYLGQTSPNPWHNPTTLAVRPFMILITVLTVRYYDFLNIWPQAAFSGNDGQKKTAGKGTSGHSGGQHLLRQLVLMVLLAAATLIKPSFLMIYFPACGLIALAQLIRSRGRRFLTLLLGHLYMLPALFIMLSQYLSIFAGSGSAGEAAKDAAATGAGVTIALFQSAKVYAPSVLISLLLLMAFPLLVTLLWWKEIRKDRLFVLAGLEFLMGLVISWTLTETGKREKSGNFGWCKILGASMLWIVCLAFYAAKMKERGAGREQIMISAAEKVRVLLPALTLLWHVLAGLLYYAGVLHNPASQL